MLVVLSGLYFTEYLRVMLMHSEEELRKMKYFKFFIHLLLSPIYVFVGMTIKWWESLAD